MTYGNNLMVDWYQVYGTGAPAWVWVYNLAAGLVPPVRADINSYYATGPQSAVPLDKTKVFWMERYLGYSGGKLTADNYFNPLVGEVGPVVGGVTFTAGYDGESRLREVVYSDGRELHYTYDRLGNRTSSAEDGVAISYEYDSVTNRLTRTVTDGVSANYLYDARGNLVETEAYEYQYDLFNRLVSARDKKSGKVASNYYTSSGERYLKVTDQFATVFFYGAGSNLIYEATYSRSDLVSSTALPIASTHYFHAAGMTVGKFSTGSEIPGFLSRFSDPDVGLYQLGARWYDPTIGRFVSADPIPSSLNQYAYAGNNPFRYQDWSGLQSFDYSVGVIEKEFQLETGVPADEFPKYFLKLMGIAYIDVMTNLTPGISESRGIIEGACGRDLVYGIKLDWKWRVFLVTTPFLAFAKEVRPLAREARLLDEASDIGRSARLGWQVGEPITNLTKGGRVPVWSTIRRRFWKSEAFFNFADFYEEQLVLMRKGNAPQQLNPHTGLIEYMELHHNPPMREGGLFDFEPLWPGDHANVDPLRRLKR